MVKIRMTAPTRRPQRDESCGSVHSTLLGEVSVRIQDNCAKIIFEMTYTMTHL